MSHDGDSKATGTDGQGLGKDGTIPDSPDGIAVGHDPDGSHFNPEEDTDGADDADSDGAPTSPAAGSDSTSGDDDPYEIETDLGPDGPAQV
ncbi:hypothetical protein [Herbiconiux sp. YIM B11900]|uniref:hypothetical protein n=1 Tax=Herbiconiux sp. YIM B11900 TaxID=3404131 RepID=UPI003F868F9B